MRKTQYATDVKSVEILKLPERHVIPDFYNYGITKEGRVYRRRSGRVLKREITQNGKQWITLCEGGQPFRVSIAHLLLVTFVGRRKKNDIPVFKNGMSGDHSLKNLEWGPNTRKVRVRLNTFQLRIMRRLLEFEDPTRKDIAEFFNITTSGVFKLFGNRKTIRANRPKLLRPRYKILDHKTGQSRWVTLPGDESDE